jgi:hypothetical protein
MHPFRVPGDRRHIIHLSADLAIRWFIRFATPLTLSSDPNHLFQDISRTDEPTAESRRAGNKAQALMLLTRTVPLDFDYQIEPCPFRRQRPPPTVTIWWTCLDSLGPNKPGETELSAHCRAQAGPLPPMLTDLEISPQLFGRARTAS